LRRSFIEHFEIKFGLCAPGLLFKYEFHNQKSSKKEDEEQKRKEVEVSIDEILDLGSEFSDEARFNEETERTTDGRGDKKKDKIEFEDSGSDGEDFIGNRSEAGCKNIPESVVAEIHHHPGEKAFRESRNILEKEGIHQLPYTETDEVPDDTAYH